MPPAAKIAFQAMKAFKAQCQKFANVVWTEAVAMGREQVIDVTSWDANRETLMESVLTAQAKENPGFKEFVLMYANKGLHETMSDTFRPTALPGIWKNVRASLKQEADEEEGEEEGEEEEGEKEGEEEDDEEEEQDAQAQALGRNSLFKRARRS